ncbi:hypothetical protein TorRG33x02_253650 [Trema orientale]|uniref:Uncharacterized protein n=1 Tax=Trema orientale TaxID=63057 RepID=A0A2P5DET4_TREOI|nr:hypothetical protein TorRG33x02_253650 [Trema orientale]
MHDLNLFSSRLLPSSTHPSSGHPTSSIHFPAAAGGRSSPSKLWAARASEEAVRESFRHRRFNLIGPRVAILATHSAYPACGQDFSAIFLQELALVNILKFFFCHFPNKK